MTALYDRMDTLPPRLQMFMAGCPAELEARRERISCRQVVTRTVRPWPRACAGPRTGTSRPSTPGPSTTSS